eukprot:gene3684-biopygen1011
MDLAQKGHRGGPSERESPYDSPQESHAEAAARKVISRIWGPHIPLTTFRAAASVVLGAELEVAHDDHDLGARHAEDDEHEEEETEDVVVAVEPDAGQDEEQLDEHRAERQDAAAHHGEPRLEVPPLLRARWGGLLLYNCGGGTALHQSRAAPLPVWWEPASRRHPAAVPAKRWNAGGEKMEDGGGGDGGGAGRGAAAATVAGTKRAIWLTRTGGSIARFLYPSTAPRNRT